MTVLILWALFSGAGVVQPPAQTDRRDVELGVVVPWLCLTEHEGADVGLGGRLTYNLAHHVALEGELSWFARELVRMPVVPTVPMTTDRRVQALFGMKAGTRWEWLGLFGKVRPGVVHFRNELHVVCVTEPCPPIASSQTELALDLGGIVELYPTPQLVIRFDVGDLWIRGTGNDVPGSGNVKFTRDLGHNFQVSSGLSIRF